MNSSQTVVSDGSLALLNISFEYFDRTHVHVLFDGVEQTLGTTWSWVGSTNKTIQFSPAVSNGVTVRVQRVTPLNAPRHIYSSPGNAPFNKSTVDENFRQTLYASQEAAEGATLTVLSKDVSAAGNKLTELGDAMLDGDAVNLKVLREYLPYGPAAASLAARIAAEEQHSAELASSAGASLVGFKQRGSGATSRTVQSKLQDCDVSLADFTGFDNTGVASINACLALAKTYLDSITVTPDAAGPRVRGKLIIPPGTYLLTADADLPIDIECHGRFIGDYKLKMTNVKRPKIKGLSCKTLQISGSWFGLYEDVFADSLLIDGGGVGFGTFWNTFLRVQAHVTIDLSNWSVNQNTFTGRGGFVTVGSGADALDGHANNTSDWDFTGGQCSNTSSLQQDSMLVGAYYEAGADVVGPYHMVGFQGDAGGPPQVNRRNHIFASYDVIEKNSADFLATGGNMLAGGSWDYLDSNGKPPCLASAGAGAVAYAVLDATEPFGMGAKYGATYTAAFSNFTVGIPPCRTGKFSLVLAYQSAADFETIEVNWGGGVSYGGASSITVDTANNWKILRLSGRANPAGPTIITLFAFGGAGGSKTMYIGGLYATQEKAAQYPAPQYIREAHGTISQGYVSGAYSVAIAVSFPKRFSSLPTVITSISSNGAQTANYTKVIVEDLTVSGFTARVYYYGDWTGKLNWFARGEN